MCCLRRTDVVKHFPVDSTALVRRRVTQVFAVDGVSLERRRGETLGLVGETGCGKSTLARCILGSTTSPAGRSTFDGARHLDALARAAAALPAAHADDLPGSRLAR